MLILIALAIGLVAILVAIAPINTRIKYPSAHVLITASLCLLSWGMYVVAQAQDVEWQASEYWAPTKVTILNANRETKTQKRHNKPDQIRHSFKVRYEYKVDGQTYENTRYTMGVYNSSSEAIDQLINHYRDQSLTHTGLYDPQDPSNSTLIRGNESPQSFLLLFVFLPGAAGAYLLYRLVINAYHFIAGKNIEVTNHSHAQ